jgi:ankyrin repeat protein
MKCSKTLPMLKTLKYCERRIFRLLVLSTFLTAGAALHADEAGPMESPAAAFEHLTGLVNRGDLAGAKQYLARDARLNLRGQFGRRAIEAAVFSRNPKLVKFLVEGGAYVNGRISSQSRYRDYDNNETILMVAMDRGPIETVKTLIENGACVNSFSSNQYSTIGYAEKIATFASSNPAVVSLLRAHGAVDDPRDIDGKFSAAVEEGDLEQAAALLKQGADINGLPWETSPLAEAENRNNKKVIRFLLEHGADAIGPPGRGPVEATRPLIAYLESNIAEPEMVAGFLDAGETLDEQVIEAALDKSQPPAALVLWLFKNADLRAYLKQQKKADSLASFIARSGRKDLMEALLATGFDANWVRQSPPLDQDDPFYESVVRETLLGDAAIAGGADVVQLVLNKGVPINGSGRGTIEPVYLAALAGKEPVVRLLVKNGTDAGRTFGEQDNLREVLKRGQLGTDSTLLLWALDKGFIGLASELIATNVPLNVQDHLGRAALHVAVALGNTDLVRALVEKGADTAVVDHDGITALMEACKLDNLEMVKLLATKPALNARSREGATALMWAAAYGRLRAVQALVALGADVNAVTNNGQVTALTAARTKGYIDIAKILADAGGREPPPPEPPKAIDYSKTTKAQWFARFRELRYDPNFSPMVTPTEQGFKAVFGEPVQTQMVRETVFWYYQCVDGTIQLKLANPALTGSRLIFQGVNGY